MTKTLLILSGDAAAAHVAHRAKEMGHYVVIADGDPAAPGFGFADSCLIADVFSPDATAAAAERFHRKIRPVDGVVCAVEAPLTVAAVSRRLDLRGLSTANADLLADRLALHERLRRAGVPVPWSAAVATPQALARIVIEKGRALVIRPVDANNGVQLLPQARDIDGAFAAALSHSPGERVMVEQYLDGPRVLAESLVVGGYCHTPFLTELDHERGDGLPADQQARIRDFIARAATALGIVNGTVISEIAIGEGAPLVISLSACISGSRSVRGGSHPGADFIGAAIQIALGEPVTLNDIPENEKPAELTVYMLDGGRHLRFEMRVEDELLGRVELLASEVDFLIETIARIRAKMDGG